MAEFARIQFATPLNLGEFIYIVGSSVEPPAHSSMSFWSALRDLMERDACGFEFLESTFAMSELSLLVAILPVSQAVGGALQSTATSG